MENKRGFTTVSIIAMIFFAVIALVTLAVISFSAGEIDKLMSSIDFELGNQSFNETYQSGMGAAVESIEVTGPKIISIGLILGMVLICLAVAYWGPVKNNLWALLDIPIIIAAEIFAVAIRNSFSDYIINMTPELYQVFTTTLATGSKWVLNMPTIIPIVGVVMMLVTYIFKKDKEESKTGFYQYE